MAAFKNKTCNTGFNNYTIAVGVDVKAVSALLGHSQTSTTLNIYAHAVQQTNKTALSSVANLLETA